VPSDTLKERWEQAKLDELLDGLSRVEFTLRFTLSHPDLSTTIVGTKSLAHLQDNVSAAKAGPLAPSIVKEAKRRLSRAAESGAQASAR
jgi:aryl-alcohol dehydrogenase-like predicted oxidoreductase